MGTTKKTFEQLDLFAGTQVWAALFELVPLVSRFLSKPQEGMVNFKLVWRGDNDFLAVAKRYGDDGIVEVVFGSGQDAVGSIIGLETAMEHSKWRPDKWMNKQAG